MRRGLRFAAISVLLAGCSAGEGGNAFDSGNAQDTREGIQILDSLVIERGAPDFGLSDSTIASDETAVDDRTPESSEIVPSLDVPTFPELPLVKDVSGDLSPDIGSPKACGKGGVACPPGHECVPSMGGKGPVCEFVAECSDKGVMKVEDLLAKLVSTGQLYGKVEAKVWSGPAGCTVISCSEDNPCCNECYAQLFIGSHDLPLVLLGNGFAIGCRGTECDVGSVCGPLVPDKWYRIWGTLTLLGKQPQFTVEGFCLAL